LGRGGVTMTEKEMRIMQLRTELDALKQRIVMDEEGIKRDQQAVWEKRWRVDEIEMELSELRGGI